ncbi:MAG: glucosaminidase domain-containing protein [Sphingobacteriales bacterium]|nr:glucosaminidase domain-containing protein [Sphingobacteriales bacterium]
MQRTGVPAAITLAQGIHESGAGKGKLALNANNHFGIKCKSNWTGESVKHDDDAKKECFRKYPSAEDSYKDHSDFLKNSQRYVSLFALDPSDYSGWAYGLKKAGYATNPKYPQVLIKLIEDYQLQDYTMIALGKRIADTMAINVSMAMPVTQVDEFKVEGEAVRKIDYPEGEFKLNETKVVYVKKGISFLFIAKQYNVDLSKIFDFNDMQPAEQTEKDQLIYLQRKRKTGNNEFHVIQAGETLHDIAQTEAIRLESLLELNWLKEGEMPAVGEKLGLKKKSATIPKLALKSNYSLTGGNKLKSTN